MHRAKIFGVPPLLMYDHFPSDVLRPHRTERVEIFPKPLKNFLSFAMYMYTQYMASYTFLRLDLSWHIKRMIEYI